MKSAECFFILNEEMFNMNINLEYSILKKKNLSREGQFSKAFLSNCLRMASVVAIAASFSGEAFSATLTSDVLDNTSSPLLYRENPIASDPINFPAVAVSGATAGPLNYYFGMNGTATSGVTPNQGSVAFTAGSITGATAATPGTFTYTPAPGFFGDDMFTFYMHGSSVDSISYTVNILVGDPLNVETVAQAVDFALTPVATALSHFVAAGGVPPYTYSVTVEPIHGTLSATNAATPTYTPEDLYYGADHFYYTVTDSATPPAIRSGKFDLNVQGQGIHTLPEEGLSVAGQITGERPFVIDGGGKVTLNNTQPSAQNSFSGGTLVKDSVLILTNAPQLPTSNTVRLNGGFIGAKDKTVIANHIDLR